jgi:hypothetical protein
MQGGGCGPAAAYYGAPCGGQYRVGQPIVGAGYAHPYRQQGIGSPEERLRRLYIGSPEERFGVVGQRGGGRWGGGHHGGGHHGGHHFGGGFWGWPGGYYGWPYAWDGLYDYGGYDRSQCVFDQRTGRWVCYVWDPARGGWVVVG